MPFAATLSFAATARQMPYIKAFQTMCGSVAANFRKQKKVNRMLIAHYILVSPFKIIKRCAPIAWSTFINYLILAANLAGLRRLSHISTIQIVVLVT